jgi:hypothetical protein
MDSLSPTLLIQRAGLRASHGCWTLETIKKAASAVGWCGALRGPVLFGGTAFIAVCRPSEPPGAPGSPWLVGCLFPAADPRAAMRDASLLAGYSRRTILVRDPSDALDIQLQTALLDQGAIADSNDKLIVLSTPGDVVPSPLQERDNWRNDERWLSFYQVVTRSRLLSHVH